VCALEASLLEKLVFWYWLGDVCIAATKIDHSSENFLVSLLKASLLEKLVFWYRLGGVCIAATEN
jgi:hypothetical protein